MIKECVMKKMRTPVNVMEGLELERMAQRKVLFDMTIRVAALNQIISEKIRNIIKNKGYHRLKILKYFKQASFGLFKSNLARILLEV